MRTVVRGAVSPTADDATVSAPNQRSRVTFTAFLRDTFFSRHDFRSAISGPASTPIAPQGSNFELFRTASAAETAVFSMLIPVSEKKFLCVNRGWHSKSCIHATAPFSFSWLIATPLRDTIKTGYNSEGPFTFNAVNWKIWKQHTCSVMRMSRCFQSTMKLTFCNLRRKRKPGWLQNAKTLLIGTRDLLPLASTCRCSRTKELNSAVAGSVCDPLTQPNSSSPSSSCPKEVESQKFVTSNDDLRTKTAQSLPNRRTRGNCREDGAHEILKEATTVSTVLFLEEAAVYFCTGRN